MNRSDEPLFDARIADWFEEDPIRAPDQTLEVVLAAFRSIKQRRAIRVPWRSRVTSAPLKLLAAAMALAVVAVGVYLVGRGPGGVGGPEPSASPTPAATLSRAPSQASNATPSSTPAPPATATFTSPIYGYTIEHPILYQPTPATEAWVGGHVGNAEPWVDRFLSPISFVGIAGQQLASGQSDVDWMDAYVVSVAGRQPCDVPGTTWTETTVDGSPARRAEFDCQGSAGVEIHWVVNGGGWVISGERAIVDQMIATMATE